MLQRLGATGHVAAEHRVEAQRGLDTGLCPAVGAQAALPVAVVLPVADAGTLAAATVGGGGAGARHVLLDVDAHLVHTGVPGQVGLASCQVGVGHLAPLQRGARLVGTDLHVGIAGVRSVVVDIRPGEDEARGQRGFTHVDEVVARLGLEVVEAVGVGGGGQHHVAGQGVLQVDGDAGDTGLAAVLQAVGVLVVPDPVADLGLGGLDRVVAHVRIGQAAGHRHRGLVGIDAAGLHRLQHQLLQLEEVFR